ncbi:MAG: thiamine-phosphate kinase [Phycisphaerales bacterium]|nr:thiamine-phosphate kinase [Phycisphaerales bacterium]
MLASMQAAQPVHGRYYTSTVRESEVLKSILGRSPSDDPRVLIGPGDDLACVRVSPPESPEVGPPLLVGADQVIDGLHVRADLIPWDLIGRKAVCRALSDVAAMAGRPVATIATALLPADAEAHAVEKLCTGLFEAAALVHAPLVGGDVAIHRTDSGPLSISVTVLATPSEQQSGGQSVRRDGARVGDRLVVTGPLGGAVGADGFGHHLTFTPRLSEAVMLRAILGVDLHAMIDLSDGLGRDAGRIAAASGVHMMLDAMQVPCRTGVSWEQAVGDGEDYELLLAVGPEANLPEALGGSAESCHLHVIGEVVEASADTPLVGVRTLDGEVRDVSAMGWDHG